MEPLKITFTLANDMVYPAMPLHLDALLAYAVTQDNLVTLGDNPSPDDLLALSEDMPIAKHEQDGQWVYKASALAPEGLMTHSRHFFTQRQDPAKMAALIVNGKVQYNRYKGEALPPLSHKMKLDLTRGAQRNLLGYYSITNVPTMTAYCVADRDFVEEYLIDSGWITHIGGRRRQGLGRLARVDIETCDAAQTLWQNRVKPFALHEDDTPIIATCRPPYWEKANQQPAFIPALLT